MPAEATGEPLKKDGEYDIMRKQRWDANVTAIRWNQKMLATMRREGVTSSVVEAVLQEADAYFYDRATDHWIAVKRMVYKGAERDVCVPYDITGGMPDPVSIHPKKAGERERYIRSGRWIPYERGF